MNTQEKLNTVLFINFSNKFGLSITFCQVSCRSEDFKQKKIQSFYLHRAYLLVFGTDKTHEYIIKYQWEMFK